MLAAFKSYAGQTLKVWVHSDQKGAYVLAKRGIGAGQPIEDLFGTIVLGVRDNLTSVWYYITLFIILVATSKSRARLYGRPTHKNGLVKKSEYG